MVEWNVTWARYAEPNITGFYDAIVYANDTTSGVFGASLCFSVFTILFIVFRRWGDIEAFATASFLTAMLSGALRAMGAISDWLFMIFIVASAVSVIVLMKQR